MAQVEASWDPVAKTLGFENENEMLKYLYVQEKRSIGEIAKVVGFAPWSVRRRLLNLEVPLRRRGGPNHAGKRKLGHISDEELAGNPVKLACNHKVHISTVFAERRIRSWNSAPSVPQDGSTDLQEGAELISSLQISTPVIGPTPSGTVREFRQGTPLYSTTEPMKESSSNPESSSE